MLTCTYFITKQKTVYDMAIMSACLFDYQASVSMPVNLQPYGTFNLNLIYETVCYDNLHMWPVLVVLMVVSWYMLPGIALVQLLFWSVYLCLDYW